MGLLDLMVRDGATGLWLLDELTGTAAKDIRSSKNGTYGGTLTLGGPGLIYGDTRKALSLAGAGYVTVPDDPIFETHVGASGLASLELVVKPTTSGVTSWLVAKGDNPYEFGIALNPDLTVSVSFWTSTGAPVLGYATGIAVPINQASHVLSTYDRAAPLLTTYVNGVAASTSSLANGAVFTSDSGSSVTIGRRGDGSATPLTGSIGPVAYYPTALSVAQAVEHYKSWLRGAVSY